VHHPPILISVYTRLEHLKRCVDSLRMNPISCGTDLYVVSDAASSGADEGKVESVRKYLNQIEGFRGVIPVNREKNMGSFLSVKTALDGIFEKHERVVFMEDDNVVSPNFLAFVEKGLEIYRDDPSIFSISGYHYPIRIPKDYRCDIYKWQGFSALGVGLWRHKWQALDWDYPGFSEVSKDRRKRKILDRYGEHLYGMILYNIKHRRNVIDVAVSYNLYLKNMYSIFPVVSKVRNMGYDGSGEHVGVKRTYRNQPLDPGKDCQFIPEIQPDERINQAMRRYFRMPVKTKMVSTLAALIPEDHKKWVKKQIYWDGTRR